MKPVMPQPYPPPAAPAAEEVGEPPRFASLDVFVRGYVLPNWPHRRTEQSRWCRRWWEHTAAITRLEALWEGFEVMHREPAPGLSLWLREHFDYQMSVLTGFGGPFWNCAGLDDEQPAHSPSAVWPAQAAPDGLFAVDPQSPVQTPHLFPSSDSDVDALHGDGWDDTSAPLNTPILHDPGEPSDLRGNRTIRGKRVREMADGHA